MVSGRGALADTWQKPVLFTEISYATRKDPAIRPWEWPDAMTNVHVDEVAQAGATARSSRRSSTRAGRRGRSTAP